MEALNTKYTKAIVALVLSVITAFAAAVGNGSLGDLGTEDWVKLALVILGGSALTGWAENVPAAYGGVIKSLLGGATAALTAWTVAYENDLPLIHKISQGEWMTIAIAAITALTAVYQFPNGPETPAAATPTTVKA